MRQNQMNTLHGVWSPDKKGIFLWLEKKNKLVAPAADLISGKKGSITLMLPMHRLSLLPSPLIARTYNIGSPDQIEWDYCDVDGLYTDISDLKHLVQTEKLNFAQDLLYWINMLGIISEIFDNDLYIPSINQDNEPTWTVYYPDIHLLASQMPDICCYINNNYYDKQQLLQCFLNTTITDIGRSLVLSRSQERTIQGTLLGKFFGYKKAKITDEEKNNWRLWKSALDKVNHTICLKLDAPEHQSSQWRMNVLVKDKDDASKQTPLTHKWHDYLDDLGIAMRIYPELEAAFNHNTLSSFVVQYERLYLLLGSRLQDSTICQNESLDWPS